MPSNYYSSLSTVTWLQLWLSGNLILMLGNSNKYVLHSEFCGSVLHLTSSPVDNNNNVGDVWTWPLTSILVAPRLKNAWTHTLIFLHVFMSWNFIPHAENLIFILQSYATFESIPISNYNTCGLGSGYYKSRTRNKARCQSMLKGSKRYNCIQHTVTM